MAMENSYYCRCWKQKRTPVCERHEKVRTWPRMRRLGASDLQTFSFLMIFCPGTHWLCFTRRRVIISILFLQSAICSSVNGSRIRRGANACEPLPCCHWDRSLTPCGRSWRPHFRLRVSDFVKIEISTITSAKYSAPLSTRFLKKRFRDDTARLSLTGTAEHFETVINEKRFEIVINEKRFALSVRVVV